MTNFERKEAESKMEVAAQHQPRGVLRSHSTKRDTCDIRRKELRLSAF
jgi:hypothetical protein